MFLSRINNYGRKIRVFTLSENFINKFKGTQPNWGYNGLGYFVYKRTYSRELPNGTTEEFWQTCRRVVEGVYTIQKQHCKTLGLPWDDRKAQNSAQEMYQRMWEFKFLPPGRGLWAMGTDMVYEKGSAALNNCAFVSTQHIDIDFSEPFIFLMDMSMYGVGVGGDCKGTGKVKIYTPEISEDIHIVDDSREGWVEIIRIVLNSFIKKNPLPRVIDYSLIRPKGSPIHGFGGVASGPGPLIELVENLKRLLCPETDGQLITSTQIVDIFNYIGKCVVSGGVRRTAEIMFSEPEDQEFIKLKQDKEALMDRRWASNNSVFARIGMDYSELSKLIATNGEPGFIWLDHMRRFGRMIDPPNNKDSRAMGSNPCSEQTLEDHELCCLVETFPSRHSSFKDYERTLKYAYLYGKSVTLVPTHCPKTNAVMMRNRRIGCSMSGIIQAITKFGRNEFFNMCNKGYKYIKNLDKVYSDWLCVPRSIKMTSVKPSGTVSLLCGATPGIHFPHSKYYIRRVRIQDSSPLIEACIKAGYPTEKCKYATDTIVISFPVKEKHFIKGKNDVSIWEQFSNAADMQAYWADNQVSVTVTFNESEKKEIKTCLEIFERRLKSISLLPLNEHGYTQAPYQSISKKEYLTLSNKLKPLIFKGNTHDILAEEKFCDGDTCNI